MFIETTHIIAETKTLNPSAMNFMPLIISFHSASNQGEKLSAIHVAAILIMNKSKKYHTFFFAIFRPVCNECDLKCVRKFSE
jgi:hypothetical protein